MHYTVYKTTNLVNGKVYIGTHQTESPNDEYLGSGHQIKRAIAKYGVENFRKEVLFDFDNASDMFAKEAELVDEAFCDRKDTYNICPGGYGGFGYINSNGLKLTEVHRKSAIEKLSTARSKRAWLVENDPEWNETRISKLNFARSKRVNFSRPHTEESKKKISIANSLHQMGSNNSQFGTMWITNGTENKKIKKIDSVPEGWYRGRK